MAPTSAQQRQQRSYSAPCPGCGAPVLFRSAQSAYAVCGYCQSTIVRQGEVLSRIGRMAELFEDFSPLQLMTSGMLPGESPEAARRFTLVGRLQYQSPTGPWTEWQALFDDGSTGVLGEDNGGYAFSRAGAPGRAAPAPEHLRLGAVTVFDGKPFTVSANRAVTLASAQGELPKLPAPGQPFAAVELRSDDGEVLTIEYGGDAPSVSRGRAVQLDALQLTGLKDGSTRQETARQFNCPNCGAPVQVKLATTQSITCASCHSIIDLSHGIGAELHHAGQRAPSSLARPLLALGAQGRLQGVWWQFVGFQHRTGHAPGDDESFGWNEYLLFNEKRGFAFLVDAQEGWSFVQPTTGAPKMKKTGSSQASYLGVNYQLKESYEAETGYVAGEFYWPVARGQKSFVREFASGSRLLTLEQTPTELNWSIGGTISSRLVFDAFGVEDTSAAFSRGDVKPLSAQSRLGCGTLMVIVVVLLIFLLLLSLFTDDGDRASGSRSSGGSYGGHSSGGGGHK